MNVLILGVTGMLGHKLAQVLPTFGVGVTGTVRGDADRVDPASPFFADCAILGGVDVLDGDAVERVVRELRPDWIVNCVGIVKQLPEAQDRYRSVAVNSLLPHRLANLAAECSARLVHFSTDCVFDGKTGGYADDAPSDAYDVYGKSKYLGETDAREWAALTIRSSIIGPELYAPRTGLLEWFLGQSGATVQGFVNAIFSGLTTLEMSRVVGTLITGGAELAGTYNVAAEPISKYDLLGLMRDAYALDVAIVPEYAFHCDRSLTMARFGEATGYRAPDWFTMIAAMAAEQPLYAAAAADRAPTLVRARTGDA